jgi:hypothetical protein
MSKEEKIPRPHTVPKFTRAGAHPGAGELSQILGV